jgi:hypothetical protein
MRPEPAPSTFGRRSLLAGLAIVSTAAAFGVIGHAALADRGRRVFAFVPALVSARVIADVLNQGLPGMTVTVFGRFGDFAAAVSSQRPESVLCPFDTLEELGLRPALRGELSGSAREPYVVLTKEAEGGVAELAKKTIGAVDIVGRAALPGLVQKLLGLSFVPSVRRVLQVGDLLPLLHLDLAPTVVLPERFYPEFYRMSHLKLRALKPSSAELGRVTLAYPSGISDAAIEEALRRAPAKVRELLGVESWV